MKERYILRYDLRMKAGSEDAEVLVYGGIVSRKWNKDDPDVTAKDFDAMLKDAKAKGAKRLNLRINSGGGSVYQAVAMRAMLMSAGFDSITVNIEGLCASAATLLACVPDATVRMHGGSMYMIHNPSGGVWGNASDMEHEAEILRKMEADFADMYAQRSGKDAQNVRALMDAETWFTAKEAVENGFADECVEGGEQAACVAPEELEAMREIYAHVPEMTVRIEPPANSAAGSSENTQNEEQEDRGMEIKDITQEQLNAENPALCASIATAAVEAERARIAEIDELTMPGYEAMAAQAKADGTSALDFHKMVVKAQKQKGATFMQQRAQETAKAAKVTGGATSDVDGKNEREMEAGAKETAEFAKEFMNSEMGGMF